MKTLDCRNMQCPQPVLETRKELIANPDEPLTVLVSNDVAQANVSRFATKDGYAVSATVNGDDISLLIIPNSEATVQNAPAQPGNQAANSDTIVYISSSCMGNGSDKLGEVLMRNFIFTLAETSDLPSAILFVNSGVKLTCTGSEVLEPLHHLSAKGVEVRSCGLCLEFFDLKEQLAIGQISNMLETVEAMQQAGRIINP